MTSIHLCNHCAHNRLGVCSETEASPLITEDVEEYLTLSCPDFIQRTFPYCPHCGTPFTLANEVIDPDGTDNYLEENLGSDGLIGFTCLNCGELVLVEDIK